jgi:AcrR family transcriptional regulator
MRDRLANGGADKLLDDMIPLVMAGGFAEVKIADLARSLSCSATTLYKIAPSKSELIIAVIRRWGEQTLARAETRSRTRANPADRARTYYLEGADNLGVMSPAFRRDVQRFTAASQTYRGVSDRFVERFAGLLEEAAAAGEVRPLNAVLLVGLLTDVARTVRDEDLLARAGLTAREALLEVDTVIWEGVLFHPKGEHP